VALTQEGNVRGWGKNDYKQCDVPRTLLGNAIAVCCNGDHTAALTVDRTVVCWGSNSDGQGVVPPTLRNVAAISCGISHTAAFVGKVVCWGSNTYGQCKVPVDLEHVGDIRCGAYFSAVLTRYGDIRCWGENDKGQCCVSASLGKVVALSCGRADVAALTVEGRLVCWGNKGWDQCTVSTDLQVMMPQMEPQQTNIAFDQVPESRNDSKAEVYLWSCFFERFMCVFVYLSDCVFVGFWVDLLSPVIACSTTDYV
jgi:alpha-tubulin suppressor-like RCC1 family protein